MVASHIAADNKTIIESLQTKQDTAPTDSLWSDFDQSV